MNRFLLAVGAAALAGGGVAVAQNPAAVGKWMTRTEARADVAAHVQRMFARLDTNRDGFITKAEADAMRAQHAGKMGKRAERRNPGAMFDRLDANHDGAVTRAEFDAAHAQMHARMEKAGMHRGMGGRMFDLADGNKDGKVSLAEAQAVALAHFDRADLNHDGTLTPQERQQMHQQMRAQHKPS